MAAPCRGAVPPKTQLCPGVRAGGSPQGTQRQLLHPGELGGPPTMLCSSAPPRNQPRLAWDSRPSLISCSSSGSLGNLPTGDVCSPGFMASVVSLSWLQLGKGWLGMKGAAAPGGMAGRLQRLPRHRVTLGYWGCFSSTASSSLSLLQHGLKSIWRQSQAPAAQLGSRSCPQEPPAGFSSPPDSEMPSGPGRAATTDRERFLGEHEQVLLLREVWAGGEGQKEPEKGFFGH